MRPEIAKKGKKLDESLTGYGKQVDMWNLGIILYILLSSELQEKARQALSAAVKRESPNIDILKDALFQARNAGLSQDEIRPAKEAFAKEEECGKARGELKPAPLAILSPKSPTVGVLQETLQEEAWAPRYTSTVRIRERAWRIPRGGGECATQGEMPPHAANIPLFWPGPSSCIASAPCVPVIFGHINLYSFNIFLVNVCQVT